MRFLVTGTLSWRYAAAEARRGETSGGPKQSQPLIEDVRDDFDEPAVSI